MDPWPRFVAAVLERHGVGCPALATAHGISSRRFFRRAAAEEWASPTSNVRVHPDAPDRVQRELLVACLATRHLAAASHDTAAWLHGLRDRPPEVRTVLAQHDARFTPPKGIAVRRARWLSADDVVEVKGVPVLALPAMFLSSLGTPPDAQRARLIDTLHRGLVTGDQVAARCDEAGPLPGKALLRTEAMRLASLQLESVFQDDVATELARLGYRVDRSPRRLWTPDGVGLQPDITLEDWQVSIETEGDAFHRTREQRRTDRRRMAAYAATSWVPVPIDWRDWQLDRDHTLDAVDDAIEAQRRRGIGTDVEPPRRPRRRRTRAA